MGLIQFLLTLPGIAIGIGLGYLLYPTMDYVGIIIAVGVFIVYIVVLSLIFNVANSVYNTALFVYADTGKIPTGYNQNLMSNAFKQKKVRTR